MTPGLVVKLRPTSPWRTGSDSGAPERVELAYHSDSVYAAVTSALWALGYGEEWLEATARCPAFPAVAFSSAFPFLPDIRFIVPPKTVWPPAPSPRVRWKSARFVPVPVVEGLLRRRMPDDDRWAIDGASACLVPVGTRGPFRPAVRSRAAVDRLRTGVHPHSRACLEFAPGAGLWIAVVFAGEEENQRWAEPVRSAFRLLADSGFGGCRSSGWGRCETPEFVEGDLPSLVATVDWPKPPEQASQPEGEHERPNPPDCAYWLLSLFVPSAADEVDWARGAYRLAPRAGRVESPAGWGLLKKSLNMVEEGSVLLARNPIRGSAPDVAPDGFTHAVYRSGFAFSIAIPWHAPTNHRVKPAVIPTPPPETASPEPGAEPTPPPDSEPRPQGSGPDTAPSPEPAPEPTPPPDSEPRPQGSGPGAQPPTEPEPHPDASGPDTAPPPEPAPEPEPPPDSEPRPQGSGPGAEPPTEPPPPANGEPDKEAQ